MQKNKTEEENPNKSLLRYAGMATQFFVGIGIALIAGLKIDDLLAFSNPIFVWLIPLLLIIFSIYKIVKDTSTNQTKNFEK